MPLALIAAAVFATSLQGAKSASFPNSLDCGGFTLAWKNETRTFPENGIDIGWGMATGRPLLAFRSVWIEKGKKKIALPISCYADLFDLKSITARKLKANQTLVTLQGGQTASHYICEIRFIGTEIQTRKVKDAEFPDHSYDLTQYVSKPIKD